MLRHPLGALIHRSRHYRIQISGFVLRMTGAYTATLAAVWGAWMNPETLPQWWGPDGFSCRTTRIDLRAGGEWVFDMIGPDGTVFPNHHRYHEVLPEERIGYSLLWGENGPKHADAWASFEDQDGATKVTLGMVFSTAAEPAVADRLLRIAHAGGQHAIGAAGGADFVTYDASAGDWELQAGSDYLGSLVFDSAAPRARHVLIGGRWVIRDGTHPEEAGIESRYRETIGRLRSDILGGQQHE